MNQKEPLLPNWLPYKLTFQEGNYCCNWLEMGTVKFEEPFFEHSLSHMKVLPQNVKMYRQLAHMDLLPSWAESLDVAAPALFIFHLSRCGSTLVTQSFCMDDENIVLSEVPFFDEILRLPLQQPGISDTVTDAWLRAAIQFHGQRRTGMEKRAVIKTDCWHVFYYEKLRQLFPQTPFVFLYRDPAEVLRSQQKRRGMQAVPGLLEPELMGIDRTAIDHADFDGYFSLVMEKILAQFYRILAEDPLALAVNYNQGIGPIMRQIADFSGYALTNETMEKIKERSRYHVKFPEQVFAEEQHAIKLPPQTEAAMHWYKLIEERRLLTASAAH